MNFSTALELIKEGNKLSRNEWNRKNQWVALSSLYCDDIKNPPFLYIKNQNEQNVPWTPTQEDLLSDDWKLLVTLKTETK